VLLLVVRIVLGWFCFIENGWFSLWRFILVLAEMF